MNMANAVMWVSYGLFGVYDIMVWGPNFVGFIFTALQLLLKLYYPAGSSLSTAVVSSDDQVLHSGSDHYNPLNLNIAGTVSSAISQSDNIDL